MDELFQKMLISLIEEGWIVEIENFGRIDHINPVGYFDLAPTSNYQAVANTSLGWEQVKLSDIPISRVSFYKPIPLEQVLHELRIYNT